jgi:hypothetical protein
MSYGGGAPQLSSAFIDLATYGELETYMYANPSLPLTPIESNGYYQMYRVGSPKSSIKVILKVIILIVIFMFVSESLNNT